MTVIALGTELGLFERTNGELTYGVCFGKQTITLNKQAYQVWQVAKMASNEPSEISLVLGISEEKTKQLLNSLVELGLIILEWPIDPTREFLQSYSLIPKGKITKYSEDKWTFKEIGDEAIVELSFFPTTIWRFANPFMNLEDLFLTIEQVSGMNHEQVVKFGMEWILYLVNRGLLSIEKWQ